MALSKVEICGVNTAKLPLLSNEEKEALFVKIKEGDVQLLYNVCLSLFGAS